MGQVVKEKPNAASAAQKPGANPSANEKDKIDNNADKAAAAKNEEMFKNAKAGNQDAFALAG